MTAWSASLLGIVLTLGGVLYLVAREVISGRMPGRRTPMADLTFLITNNGLFALSLGLVGAGFVLLAGIRSADSAFRIGRALDRLIKGNYQQEEIRMRRKDLLASVAARIDTLGKSLAQKESRVNTLCDKILEVDQLIRLTPLSRPETIKAVSSLSAAVKEIQESSPTPQEPKTPPATAEKPKDPPKPAAKKDPTPPKGR